MIARALAVLSAGVSVALIMAGLIANTIAAELLSNDSFGATLMIGVVVGIVFLKLAAAFSVCNGLRARASLSACVASGGILVLGIVLSGSLTLTLVTSQRPPTVTERLIRNALGLVVPDPHHSDAPSVVGDRRPGLANRLGQAIGLTDEHARLVLLALIVVALELGGAFGLPFTWHLAALARRSEQATRADAPPTCTSKLPPSELESYLAAFLENHTAPDPRGAIGATELWQAFCDDLRTKGEPVVSQRRFGDQMTRLKHRRVREGTSGRTLYTGRAWRSRPAR